MERLRALLEGLECREIDSLMEQTDPETFRAIGKAISDVCKDTLEKFLQLKNIIKVAENVRKKEK
jgi:hypothetical protein